MENGLLVYQQFEQTSSHTLPEHYSAMTLLHQLDHAWFYDNVLHPRIGLIDAFLPSSCPPTSLPFQSVELVLATHSRPESSTSPTGGRGKLPCGRMEPSSRGIVEKAKDATEDAKIELQQPPPADTTLHTRRRVFSKTPVDTVLAPSLMSKARVLDDHLRTSKETRAMKNLSTPALESIESGKELRISLDDPAKLRPMKVGPKNSRRNSKSMTALDFDELQGFMDLGFCFSGDDLTPRIVSMFPALQYKAGAARAIASSKQRKSSHEAWLLHRSVAPLHRRLQVPATSEDMKQHLKFWARAVASTVRQEC